jgi:prepilin signal peptidase PulO-like enzyme (type II secretory pathway)
MGMGDVKLALLLGAMLGRTVTVALMLATVLAVRSERVAAPTSSVGRAEAGRSRSRPSSPAGALIALFAGNWLLDAYLGALT